ELLTRTGLSESFDLLRGALWRPSAQSVSKLMQQLDESVAASSLPASVKDAIADERYDPAKPYNQALAHFITDSSLLKLVQTMRGAARALRNSDHVPPEAKIALLDE